MPTSFSYLCDIVMMVVLLVMAVVSLIKGEYGTACILVGIVSVQADVLRLRCDRVQ